MRGGGTYGFYVGLETATDELVDDSVMLCDMVDGE